MYLSLLCYMFNICTNNNNNYKYAYITTVPVVCKNELPFRAILDHYFVFLTVHVSGMYVTCVFYFNMFFTSCLLITFKKYIIL